MKIGESPTPELKLSDDFAVSPITKALIGLVINLLVDELDDAVPKQKVRAGTVTRFESHGCLPVSVAITSTRPTKPFIRTGGKVDRCSCREPGAI